MRSQFRIAALVLSVGLVTHAQASPPANAMVERDPAGALVVRWTDNNPVDVFVSTSPDAVPAKAKLVSQGDRDGLETLADSGTERRYFALRDTKTGDVTHVAERLLPLEQGSNFRDIGGYATTDGKHVRWGMIFRSGATPLLSNSDVAMVKSLGITNMVDLRSSEERVLAPTRLTGIRYTAIDYSMMSMMSGMSAGVPGDMTGLYRNMPAFLAPQLRVIFEDLVAGKGPILYHCSAGQDRTGVTTALILSSLGVPRETIIADYHLSTQYRRPENEMPPITPAMAAANPVAKMFAGFQNAPGSKQANPLKTANGTAFLQGAFAEIDAKWGSVDGFLEREIGLKPSDIKRLRQTYTE